MSPVYFIHKQNVSKFKLCAFEYGVRNVNNRNGNEDNKDRVILVRLHSIGLKVRVHSEIVAIVV